MNSFSNSEGTAHLRRLYGAFWQYSAGKRRVLLFAVMLLAGSQLLQLAIPLLVSQAINSLQEHQLAALPLAGRYIILVFLVLAGSWLLHGPGRLLERNVALHVRQTYSETLIGRALRAPLDWHDAHHSADLAMRIGQSTRGLCEFAESQYFHLQNTIMLIGPMVALCLISPWIGALAIVGYLALGGISIAFDRLLFEYARRQNHAERLYGAFIMEMVLDILSIYALRRASGASRLAAARLQAVFVPLRRQIALNEAKWALIDILSNLLWCSLIALFVFTEAHAAGDLIKLGPVFAVYEYLHRANGVIVQFASQFANLARQNADFTAGNMIMQAPSEEREQILAATPWRELQLADVTYRYNQADASAPALNKFQYMFRRGRTYAVIGPSGCGKSTLFRLLSGFAVPSGGELLLDGKPASAADIRAESTLLPQFPRLLEGSVAENLGFGEPLDAQSVAIALDCALDSDTSGFINDGLSTRIADGGGRLSGGQRQRISLARGIIAARPASIVLLDEPTAGLDPAGERSVLQRLLRLFPEACVIVSLHNHELLDLFDEVVSIADCQSSCTVFSVTAPV